MITDHRSPITDNRRCAARSEQEDRRYPIAEDMRFQRRSWVVERVSWALWLAVVAVALAGLFSRGPASEASAAAPGGLTVSYERFQRETKLTRFTVTAPAGQGRDVTVRLSRAFAETYEIESVAPPPVRTRSGRDALELVFAPADGDAITAFIGARPRRWGLVDLAVALAGEAPAAMRVLIYP